MDATNSTEMREALVKSDAAFSLIVKSAWFIEANFHETKEVVDASNAITAALAAPPRNCDVLEEFTADDEFERQWDSRRRKLRMREMQ